MLNALGNPFLLYGVTAILLFAMGLYSLLSWRHLLLPGTASVSLEENQVLIHVLDKHQAQQEKLENIEERIACLFGLFPS